MRQHYAETKYGFEWGAVKVQRAFSNDKRGWVTLTLETPKYTGSAGLQIYVTRTGKVRIHDARGEWRPPNVTNQARLRPSPEAGCWAILDTFHPSINGATAPEVRSDNPCWGGDANAFFAWCRQHGADGKWYRVLPNDKDEVPK